MTSHIVCLRLLLPTVFFLGFSQQAHANPDYWQAEIGVGVGVRLNGNDNTILQRAANAQTIVEDSNDVGFYKLKLRARWDTIYSGNHPYSEQAEDAYEFDSDIRHAYVGYPLENGEITIGWQQIVWGRADEVRVLDQINPIDYRDGAVELLEESRISLPMLRISQQMNEWELEGIFITAFEENRAPETGSEFYSPLFDKPDNTQFSVIDAPKYHGTDGFGYGLQFNGTIGNVDTSVVALNTRQPDPIYAATGFSDESRIELQEEFGRYSMAGFGVAIDPGYSIVIRSELAYFNDWQFINSANESGFDKNEMFKSLIGVDYLWRDWLISTQWWRQQIIDRQFGNLQQQKQDLFTLSAEASQFEDRLSSRLVLAAFPPFTDDGLIQGIFKYRPKDYLRLGLQIDIYFGNQSALFGTYDQQDNVNLSIDYLFN